MTLQFFSLRHKDPKYSHNALYSFYSYFALFVCLTQSPLQVLFAVFSWWTTCKVSCQLVGLRHLSQVECTGTSINSQTLAHQHPPLPKPQIYHRFASRVPVPGLSAQPQDPLHPLNGWSPKVGHTCVLFLTSTVASGSLVAH